MNKLLTVVIPCYNYGRFIDEALASLKAQTFQNFDIVIIDPESTDTFTMEKLKSLKQEGYNVVTEPNTGLADTRNHGMRLAATPYACILDADDKLAPTYFTKTLALLEDSTLGLAYTWLQEFGSRSNIWKTTDLNSDIILHNNQVPSQAVIRKSVWEAVVAKNGVGWRSEYNGIFEDWVFWIEAAKLGIKGQAITEPLIQYRVHPSSLSFRPERRKVLARETSKMQQRFK